MKKLLIFLIFCNLLLISCRESKYKPKLLPEGNNYQTGKLEGKRFSDLYARYLGIKDGTRLGKVLTTDFKKNFSDMWSRKAERSHSKVVDAARDELVSKYEKSATYTTFEEYTDHLSGLVTDVQENLSWKIIVKEMKMKNSEINLAKKISLSISGKDIVAYIMTELMPSANGSLNRTFLDFLLRNAGQEYIEGIPALSDRKCSFGCYQFTEYAVFSNKKESRGASVINLALPKEKRIPGSVIYLRGSDHHKAAYLFAVYNICCLIRKLNQKEMAILESKWKSNKDELFLYCATAHHNPGRARDAARLWLKHGAFHPFEQSCSPRILYYAIKTRANLAAY